MTCYYFTEFDKVNDDVYRHWLERVPEFRRRLALSFQRRQDALLSLASYLLLERALSIHGLVFYWNEFAKPYLTPLLSRGGPPFFNLSHTEGMAFCVVAETEVGGDVERIADVNNEIIETICTPNEKWFLNHSETPEYHLTRFWVLKESYFKALGCGLSLDPKSVDFSDSFPQGYTFETVSDISGYVAAVCRHGSQAASHWINVCLEDLSEWKRTGSA